MGATEVSSGVERGNCGGRNRGGGIDEGKGKGLGRCDEAWPVFTVPNLLHLCKVERSNTCNMSCMMTHSIAHVVTDDIRYIDE